MIWNGACRKLASKVGTEPEEDAFDQRNKPYLGVLVLPSWFYDITYDFHSLETFDGYFSTVECGDVVPCGQTNFGWSIVKQRYQRPHAGSRIGERIFSSRRFLILDIFFHIYDTAALFTGIVDGFHHARNCPVSKPRRPDICGRRPKDNATDKNASETPS